MPLPFNVTLARNAVPILVSVPHCGVTFPAEIRDNFDPKLIQAPDDTDWFVDRLYDFAPGMGISMISAVYSRWVIDLNRDPERKPLYSDGRIITALCPTTTFLGEPLYRGNRTHVSDSDVEARLQRYYWPYHRQLESMLVELTSRFGKVLLWDCHSIRQVVPTIQKDKFPDLILGNADEKSASAELIQSALNSLGSAAYALRHNHPFKGGYITRTYGQPARGWNALQLEMTKLNYMDDSEQNYDEGRANRMRELLKKTFGGLAEELMKN